MPSGPRANRGSTALQRTYETLRAQTHALRSILEGLWEGVVVADRDGNFLLFNESAARIVGLGSKEVPPAGWTETYGLFLPDTVTPYPPDQVPLARAIRGETVTEAEIFVRNSAIPDGAWISVNGTPWLDAAGELQGGIVVFRDITARKKADERLKRLSNAVEQTADSVVITDHDGYIRYVNPAFEQTTGYTREEALGQTPRLLRSGRQDPVLYSRMWATLLAGKVFRGTLVNRKKSGEHYYAEQTITPMKDASGAVTHFVSVARDVTEVRRGAEREIEMRLAGLVQQKLYPRCAPHFAGIDIAGAARPCAMTSGDYFDYVRMPTGRLGIVIADVSGHGLGPALIMAQTRAYLRSCALTLSDLDEIMGVVDQALLEDHDTSYFVTMLLASLHVGARALTYVNAGHPPGFVLDREGEIRHTLDSTRVPLGVHFRPGELPSRTLALEPGDTLVLLTDGILESESPDGIPFGIDNALAIVRRHRHEPAQSILERLYSGVRDHVQDGPQTDDMTAVICKVAAEP